MIHFKFIDKEIAKYIKPKTFVFLGVALGNGLEHIDDSVTKNVINIIYDFEFFTLYF